MPSAARLLPSTPAPVLGFKPHVAVIDVKSCQDLMNLQQVHASVSNKARRPSIMAGLMSNFESGLPSAYVVVNSLVRMNQKETMKCYSGATSRVVDADYNPTFDECLIVGVEGSALLVLSVFSKSTNALSEDIFIGQITIDLTSFPQLYQGETVQFEKLRWGHAAHTVVGSSGKELSVVDVEGGGTITFNLTIPLDSRSTCAEFYDIKTNSFGYFLSADRIFVTLHEGKLRQFNNKCQEKLELFTEDVTLDVKDVEEAEMEMETTKVILKGLKFTFHTHLCKWAWIHNSRVPQRDAISHMECFRLALGGERSMNVRLEGSDSGSDSGTSTSTGTGTGTGTGTTVVTQL